MANDAKGDRGRERDPFLDALGLRIKSARARKNITQKELAQHIGAGPSWVHFLEDGKQNAQINSLRRVADALGTTVHALLPDLSTQDQDAGNRREIDETIKQLIDDLTRAVGLLHKLNALRSKVIE